jgi:hypothetical protein
MLQKLRAERNVSSGLGSRSLPTADGIAASIHASSTLSAYGRSGLPLSQWTSVSNDDEAMSDLLSTLWTWDTTLTKIIHRGVLHEHICSTVAQEADLGNRGEIQFCSRFLINALLAVATVRPYQV